ncbi:MAG: 50S ribosomal protein L35 [Myxococcales bacterium]|nr:50S ribosomal protein L35 [Myxococcales bacterium]
MPKMKTRRGAAKRFSIRKSGKIKRASAYRRHLLEHKRRKMKRHLRGSDTVDSTNESAIRRMMPYG